MNCRRAHSPPRRGGVDARSIRSREATLFRADGVVSSAVINSFAGLTTPSARSKVAALQLFIHTFQLELFAFSTCSITLKILSPRIFSISGSL